MNTSCSQESGFSLIELMVVVAIIGVLSTVAMPNYQKMAAKARQVEAKSAVSAIYTIEKSYYAEAGSYTYCLWQAGYAPEGSRRFYLTGFWNGNGTCDSCMRMQDTGQLCNLGASTPWVGGVRNDSTYAMNAYANAALSASSIAEPFLVTPDTFKATGIGSISSVGIFDVWSMTEERVLTNEQTGF